MQGNDCAMKNQSWIIIVKNQIAGFKFVETRHDLLYEIVTGIWITFGVLIFENHRLSFEILLTSYAIIFT